MGLSVRVAESRGAPAAAPPLRRGNPDPKKAFQHASEVKAEVFLSNALINLGWVHHGLGDIEAGGPGFRRSAEACCSPITGRVLAGPTRGVSCRHRHRR